MDLLLDTSYLKVRVVYSCLIKATSTTKVVRKATWRWQKDITKEEKGWEIVLNYLSEDGQTYQFTSSGSNYDSIKSQFESLIKQIKDQDSTYADKLLEDAIISGGTK